MARSSSRPPYLHRGSSRCHSPPLERIWAKCFEAALEVSRRRATAMLAQSSRVWLVVPNWNVVTCSRSLARQSEQKFEVTLLDNASTGESAAWTRRHYPEARVIARRDNGGFLQIPVLSQDGGIPAPPADSQLRRLSELRTANRYLLEQVADPWHRRTRGRRRTCKRSFVQE